VPARLAFRLLMGERVDEEEGPQWTAQEVLAARARLARVHLPPDEASALCAAALALGIDSLRASVFAARVARAAAALAGCDSVEEEHTAVAARLVLAPRATRLPPASPPDSSEAQEPPPEPPASQEDQTEPPASPPPGSEPNQAQDGEDGDSEEAPEGDPQAGQTLGERVLEAAQAAIPAGLLARLKISQLQRAKTPSSGSAGAMQKNALRGRPVGARKGEPRAGQRLNVLETLRAAAPWQRLRQAAMPATAAQRPRIVVRKEDFHVARFRQLGQTTTVFVVDASGSLAINRLAETKGAVELLLADCYVRRDSVAVLAFRGKTAEVLLPPTKSLVRAKRSLSGLPGGGGTPLARAIEQSLQVALAEKRLGHTPSLVMLSDGRPNVTLQGQGGRAQALEDALTLARAWRSHHLSAIWLDTSARPEPQAQQLALAMGARYVPLPMANSNRMAQAVQAVQSGKTPVAPVAVTRPLWQSPPPAGAAPVWRQPGGA